MRAITVAPGQADSIRLDDMPEPSIRAGDALVQAIALGVCGTDFDIADGKYGAAPERQERLVIGHESLGRVLEAPAGSGLATGDWVVGIVRRPDPDPCSACAGGEWDMCRNGRYTERGIKEADGYGAERFALEPDFAVKVDPALGILGVLLEPTSVVAKAWRHIEAIGRRTRTWRPETVLVTGAGPVGLLAALLGRQRGLKVHVFDQMTDGSKPALVADLGATYHAGDPAFMEQLCPDVVLECTGAGPVVMELLRHQGRDGMLCLVGLSSGGRSIGFDVSDFNRRTVLRNDVVFGTVNANREHYEAAADALVRADRAWLSRLISRRVPLENWREAFERRPEDVKVIIDFGASAA